MRRWASLPQSHSLTFKHKWIFTWTSHFWTNSWFTGAEYIRKNNSTLANVSLFLVLWLPSVQIDYLSTSSHNCPGRAVKICPPHFYDIGEHDEVQFLLYFPKCGHTGAVTHPFLLKKDVSDFFFFYLLAIIKVQQKGNVNTKLFQPSHFSLAYGVFEPITLFLYSPLSDLV